MSNFLIIDRELFDSIDGYVYHIFVRMNFIFIKEQTGKYTVLKNRKNGVINYEITESELLGMVLQ